MGVSRASADSVVNHHRPCSLAFRHYFGVHRLRHAKAPVSSIPGLFRWEPETVKEPLLGLPQYTEALDRVGCSTSRHRKAPSLQCPFKSTNNAHYRLALILQVGGCHQLPEFSRVGSSFPNIGRDVVLRATYPRKGKTLKSPPIAIFPNSRSEP